MKVEAIRYHENDYPPRYEKHPGRAYEVPDKQADVLIERKLVRKKTDGKGSAEGVSRTGEGSSGASESDG